MSSCLRIILDAIIISSQSTSLITLLRTTTSCNLIFIEPEMRVEIWSICKVRKEKLAKISRVSTKLSLLHLAVSRDHRFNLQEELRGKISYNYFLMRISSIQNNKFEFVIYICWESICLHILKRFSTYFLLSLIFFKFDIWISSRVEGKRGAKLFFHF